MASGLLLVGDNDQVQIDGDYRNYALYQSGSVTSTSFIGNRFYATITFTAPIAEPPIVAVKSTVEVGFVSNSVNGSGEYVSTTITTSYAAVSVDFKIFIPANLLTVSTETHGIDVYDANGDLAFHSGFDYMRVYDVVEVGGTYEGNVTHASRANAYYVVNAIFGREQVWGCSMGITQVNATTANMEYMYVPPSTPVPLTALIGYDPTYNYVVVVDSE